MGIRQRFSNVFARIRPRKKTVAGLDTDTLLKGYYGLIRSALRASVPGGWASDHYEETLHFTGWNYIAGHTTALQCAAAEVEVSRPTTNAEDAWTGKVWRKRFPRLAKRSGRERYFQAIATNGRSLSKSHDQGPTEDRDVMPEDFGLCRLLNRPNESQSGAHLRYEISVQLSQTGTALIVKVPNRLGKTVEMYSVPTCLMTPRPPSSQFPRGAYYVSPAATRTNWADDSFVTMVGYQRLAGTTIDMRDLLKISIPHPLWKDEGYSPLAAGALWSDASEQIDRSRFSQFLNEARPSLIIKPPDGVNPTDNEIERVVQLLSSLYSGTSKTGRVMVAPGGCTVDQANVTPKDMDYGSGFTQLRDAIMGIHGVPLIAAGITDGGSYAAFYAALKQFIMLCVQPRLDWIAEELTYQLAPEYGDGLMIRLLASSIDDPSILESRLATDINARAIKKNEVRALRGLPEDPDGDVWVGEKETVSVNSDSAPGQTAEIAGTSDGGDERSTGIATGQPSPASQHLAAARESATPSIGEKRLRKQLKALRREVNCMKHENAAYALGNGEVHPGAGKRFDAMDTAIKQRFDVLESLLKKGGWNEADHPRGQPDNAGQFGPGGGGGGKPKPDKKKPSEKKPADGGPSLSELANPDRHRFDKQRAEKRDMAATMRVEGEDGKSKIVLADGSDVPPHIQRLAIPPAWTDVQVSMDPESPVQVTAVNITKHGKRSTKMLYLESHQAKNDALKFVRTADLIANYHGIEKQVQAARGNPKTADTADATWLMMEQATRPGGEGDTKGAEKFFGQPMTAKHIKFGEPDKNTGVRPVTLVFGKKDADKFHIVNESARREIARRVENNEPLLDTDYWLKSYGATTLEGRHVVQSKDGVRLQFMGKESVWHDHLIRDPELAKMLVERKNAAGDDGQLFAKTNATKALDFVKDLDGGGFLTKDLRTSRANLIAMPAIREIEPPKTWDEYDEKVWSVAEKVSHVLGNKPQQCIDTYIDPATWSSWQVGLPPRDPKQKKGKKERQAA